MNGNFHGKRSGSDGKGQPPHDFRGYAQYGAPPPPYSFGGNPPGVGGGPFPNPSFNRPPGNPMNGSPGQRPYYYGPPVPYTQGNPQGPPGGPPNNQWGGPPQQGVYAPYNPAGGYPGPATSNQGKKNADFMKGCGSAIAFCCCLECCLNLLASSNH